jgi:uncharacterized protein (TIRG00374 family)
MRGRARRLQPEPTAPNADLQDDNAPLDDREDIERHGAALLRDRRRIVGLVLAVVLLVVAIYIVLPKVVGLHDTIDRIGQATWYWVVAAVGFNVLSFFAYSTVFRSIFGDADEEVSRRIDLRVSYQITMAGFVATILFSAAGAGGVALTYWALRRAGMARRRAACRMVAFLVVLYTVYLAALIVFGVLLRVGALPGEHPVGGTIVPAALAGVALLVLGLVSLIPGDVGRQIERVGERRSRAARLTRAIARAPATFATGVRTALAVLRHPRRSPSTILGALGWWAGNIGILWASFEAFGVKVPFGVLVEGYFVGMVANLAPSPAAGVGTVDAGLIGAFVLFGIPASKVFPAILTFRLIGFWLPIPFGVWAYLQLRRTVARWSHERPAATIKSEVTAEAT